MGQTLILGINVYGIYQFHNIDPKDYHLYFQGYICCIKAGKYFARQGACKEAAANGDKCVQPPPWFDWHRSLPQPLGKVVLQVLRPSYALDHKDSFPRGPDILVLCSGKSLQFFSTMVGIMSFISSHLGR